MQTFKKEIKVKKSIIPLFFKYLPFEFYEATGIGILIVIIGCLIKYRDMLWVKYFLWFSFVISPALLLIGLFLYSIVHPIFEYFRLINRIKYLPLTQEEFNLVTQNMTLSECLNWFEKQITYRHEYCNSWQVLFYEYIKCAEEKYKNADKENVTPPIILERFMKYPCRCAEASYLYYTKFIFGEEHI